MTKKDLHSGEKSGRSSPGKEVVDTIMVKAIHVILIAILIAGFCGGGHCDAFGGDGKPPCHKKAALTADKGPLKPAPCGMATCAPGKLLVVMVPALSASRMETDRRDKPKVFTPSTVAASSDIALFLSPSSPDCCNALFPPDPPLFLENCSFLC